MGEKAKQLACGLADTMSGCEVEIPQKRGLGGSKTKNVYRSSDQERFGKKDDQVSRFGVGYTFYFICSVPLVIQHLWQQRAVIDIENDRVSTD